MALLPCGYRNASDRMVILRCCGPETFYLERVAFPFEFLSFEAPPSSEVEIWTHTLGGPDLIETLSVNELLMESEPGVVLAEGLQPDSQETRPTMAG